MILVLENKEYNFNSLNELKLIPGVAHKIQPTNFHRLSLEYVYAVGNCSYQILIAEFENNDWWEKIGRIHNKPLDWKELPEHDDWIWGFKHLHEPPIVNLTGLDDKMFYLEPTLEQLEEYQQRLIRNAGRNK